MSDRGRKYPHMTLCADCGKLPPISNESLCEFCKDQRREQRRAQRDIERQARIADVGVYDPESIGLVFKGKPDPERKAARLARARIQREWANR